MYWMDVPLEMSLGRVSLCCSFHDWFCHSVF